MKTPAKKRTKTKTEKNLTGISAVIKRVIDIGNEKFASDFSVIDVKGISYITDYFIIMSCKNTRQIKALTFELEKTLKKEHNLKLVHLDGDFESNWVVLDFIDFIIHIFHQDVRNNYNLENLWVNIGGGKKLDIQ